MTGRALLAFAVAIPRFALGQGVTGAAVTGVIRAPAGTPIANATVSIRHLDNGERWQTTTRASGRYFLEHLSVGGPYSMSIAAIGFAPVAKDSLFLALGERRTLDVELVPRAVTLPELEVSAATDSRINPARTGPAQAVSETTLARLPVDGRDISLLALLSPQVSRSQTGGLSFAGQSDQLNSLQIDGATNNDLLAFRLNSSNGITTVGSQGGARAVSVEAVREFQIVTAPFDVRFGNFAGGLLNAVTKSGTDQLHGSLFG
jgi:hypothetical protein